MHGIYVLIAVR